MKKIIVKIISVCLALSIMLTLGASPVFAEEIDGTTDMCSFFVNIYDENTSEFPLPNTQIDVPWGVTLLTALEELKQQALIQDYTLSENSLTGVVFSDGTSLYTMPPPETSVFYVKHNGNAVAPDDMDTLIANGDILEWIYGKPLPTVSLPTESDEKSSTAAATAWNEDYQTAIAEACDYLNLNKETTSSYLVALGSAGRTLDVKMINNLVGDVRRTKEYPSAKELAQAILSITFGGYDASELVTILSDYRQPSGIGAEDAIFMLLAYDCRGYEVEADAENARRDLVQIILKSQNENGGFSEADGANDDVYLSAMAITVLSQYSSQSNVMSAVNRAVDFLIAQRKRDGTYIKDGADSVETLAKVIIGFTSVNISMEDERLVINGESPIDILLQYQNADGGFSNGKDATSEVSATEQAVIALAAVKKNKYPYLVTQALSQIQQTTVEQLAWQVKSLSPDILFYMTAVILISVAAVFAAFFSKKRNKRRNELLLEQSQPQAPTAPTMPLSGDRKED